MTEECAVTIVFCDDIRREVARKQTLVGVYAGDILVKRIPLTIDKLAVWVSITTTFDKPFKTVAARIHRLDRDKPILDTLEIAVTDKIPNERVPGNTISFTLDLHIPQYKVAEPHKLQASVVIDGTEYRSRIVDVLENAKRSAPISPPALTPPPAPAAPPSA